MGKISTGKKWRRLPQSLPCPRGRDPCAEERGQERRTRRATEGDDQRVAEAASKGGRGVEEVEGAASEEEGDQGGTRGASGKAEEGGGREVPCRGGGQEGKRGGRKAKEVRGGREEEAGHGDRSEGEAGGEGHGCRAQDAAGEHGRAEGGHED